MNISFRIVMTMVMFAMHATLQAQDVIVTKNGREVKVKLRLVSPEEIRYRLFDLPDGPEYAIAPGDVQLIRFADGTVDTIRAVAPVGAPIASASLPFAEQLVPIDFYEGHYYRYEQRLSSEQLGNLLRESGNPEVMKRYKAYVSKRRTAKFLATMGLPLFGIAGWGLVYTLARSWQRDEFLIPPVMGGTIAGAVMCGEAVKFAFAAPAKLAEAVDQYNLRIMSMPGWRERTTRMNAAEAHAAGVDLRTRLIGMERGKYYRNNARIGRDAVCFAIFDGADPEAMNLMERVLQFERASKPMCRIGFPLLGVSLMAMLSGITARETFIVGGGAVHGVVAMALVTSGLTLYGRSRILTREAIRLHNDAILKELKEDTSP